MACHPLAHRRGHPPGRAGGNGAIGRRDLSLPLFQQSQRFGLFANLALQAVVLQIGLSIGLSEGADLAK